jgi:hypothetical protein
MEILLRGDVAMNLVGLILIAALSGGIVAVSLRLRASPFSARMWIESDRPSEGDLWQPTNAAPGRGAAWLQNPFGLKGESRLYRAVKDQLGN